MSPSRRDCRAALLASHHMMPTCTNASWCCRKTRQDCVLLSIVHDVLQFQVHFAQRCRSTQGCRQQQAEEGEEAQPGRG